MQRYQPIAGLNDLLEVKAVIKLTASDCVLLPDLLAANTFPATQELTAAGEERLAVRRKTDVRDRRVGCRELAEEFARFYVPEADRRHGYAVVSFTLAY